MDEYSPWREHWQTLGQRQLLSRAAHKKAAGTNPAAFFKIEGLSRRRFVPLEASLVRNGARSWMVHLSNTD